MIADIGTTLLQIALLISVVQCGLGIINKKSFYAYLLPALTHGAFLTLTASFGLLIYAFTISDFSVLSVYKNSHTLKPMLYKITGAWGHHEGSILLWCWVVALYGSLLARAAMHANIQHYALHIMGALQTAFIAYTLFTSNPFALIIPTPPEGLGLNPLLQDIGLAIHPPMLYFGYVGFAAVFALAIAGLATRSITQDFARIIHPWILAPWICLTLGIGLGSWWAYRELGWGGWWFWDPVENASFLPWLTATALFHANIVMKKRGNFQRWVLLLALITFILSLLGTFLVRSGILTSVHSFANDPTRGLYILAMISALSAYALWVYFRYAGQLKASTRIALFSRDMAIMLNNMLLVISMISILLAMLYPLLMEALNGKLISIGAEYYNLTFTTLMLPLLFACGFSIFLVWEHNPTKRIRRNMLLPSLLSVIITGIIISITAHATLVYCLGLLGGVWIIVATSISLYKKHRSGTRITNLLAMGIAHSALGLFVIAATLNTTHKQHYDFAMQPQDKRDTTHHQLSFNGLTYHHSDNFVTKRGALTAASQARTILLSPEERYYPVTDQFTTEADIESFLTHDLYATMKRVPSLASQTDTKATSDTVMIQFHVNPAMTWLWLSILLLGCGGGIAFYHTLRQDK